jgi:hypothetical protein
MAAKKKPTEPEPPAKKAEVVIDLPTSQRRSHPPA